MNIGYLLKLKLLFLPLTCLWLAAALGIWRIVDAQLKLVGGAPDYGRLVLGDAIGIQRNLAVAAAAIGALSVVVSVSRLRISSLLVASALTFSLGVFVVYLPLVLPPLARIVSFVPLVVFPPEYWWLPVSMIALGVCTAVVAWRLGAGPAAGKAPDTVALRSRTPGMLRGFNSLALVFFVASGIGYSLLLSDVPVVTLASALPFGAVLMAAREGAKSALVWVAIGLNSLWAVGLLGTCAAAIFGALPLPGIVAAFSFFIASLCLLNIRAMWAFVSSMS